MPRTSPADYQFRNLVFEGGGIKGVAYAGALDQLSQYGLLRSIRRVAGTSAGAITALLLALGYPIDEIIAIIRHTDYRKMADHDPGILRDSLRFLHRYGWYKGDAALRWFQQLIRNRGLDPQITFRQLARRRGDFRRLYVLGTNLSGQTGEIYSHETTPDMPAALAVRISISIPLFYQAIRRNHEVLVDGGLAHNYPVNIFDHKRYIANPRNAEPAPYYGDRNRVFNHETLGFRLHSRDVTEYEKRGWPGSPHTIRNIRDYVIALAGYLQEMANLRHLHRNDWNRTVFIDCLGVKATDFSLSSDMQERLIQSGRQGVREHFAWRCSARGTPLPRPAAPAKASSPAR